MLTKMLYLALGAGLLLATPVFAEHEDSYVKVEAKGLLHSQDGQPLFVEAGGQKFQMDIGASNNLRNFVSRHNHATVIVYGFLYVDQKAIGDDKRLEIEVHQIRTASTDIRSESAEREVTVIQEEPVRERVVVEEQPVYEREVIIEERREPFIKVGPLEIGR